MAAATNATSPHPLLSLLGKPQRNEACECERMDESNMLQALEFINGKSILERVARPGGRCVPGVHPLDPGRVGDRRRQRAVVPLPIDRDLDLADAAIRRPRDAGDGDPTGGHRLAETRHVDPRLGEDRSLLRPAEGHPVAVDRFQCRQLELGQPLGRRDIPVEAGNDQPCREAVQFREELVVHLQGDHRFA